MNNDEKTLIEQVINIEFANVINSLTEKELDEVLAVIKEKINIKKVRNDRIKDLLKIVKFNLRWEEKLVHMIRLHQRLLQSQNEQRIQKRKTLKRRISLNNDKGRKRNGKL